MKNEDKQAYRFIEKTLRKGPSLNAAPNAVHPGDAVRDVILFAAMTQRTPESAVAVLKDRAINEYKKNLITEKDYQSLNEKIKEYTSRLREATREQ